MITCDLECPSRGYCNTCSYDVTTATTILIALTFSTKKVTKLNEIIKSKIGVPAAWNNHKG